MANVLKRFTHEVGSRLKRVSVRVKWWVSNVLHSELLDMKLDYQRVLSTCKAQNNQSSTEERLNVKITLIT